MAIYTTTDLNGLGFILPNGSFAVGSINSAIAPNDLAFIFPDGTFGVNPAGGEAPPEPEPFNATRMFLIF